VAGEPGDRGGTCAKRPPAEAGSDAKPESSSDDDQPSATTTWNRLRGDSDDDNSAAVTTTTVAPTTSRTCADEHSCDRIAICDPPPQPTAGKASPQQAQALPAVVPKQGGSRYDAMAREFAANPTGNFTVQIQILCEQSNLDKAILTGGANIWFVPQAIGTRSCYRVFWGHYATREEAQKALGRRSRRLCATAARR
jgi:septal ring-binding cell division protein DamX